MSIPTAEPSPRLRVGEQVAAWTKRLSDYVDRNLRSLILIPVTITLASGLNNNIDSKAALLLRVVGPSGAFTLTGLAGASPGRMLVVYNTTSQAMTIANESASSSANNRILTTTGANVVTLGSSLALFVYEKTRWILLSASNTGGGTALDPGTFLLEGYNYVGDGTADYGGGITGDRIILGQRVGDTLTTRPGANGVIIAYPFLICRTGNIDKLFVEVTSGASAGLTCRVAIYNMASQTRFFPTSKIFDSGAVDNSTTGIKTITTGGFAATKGTAYWLAFNFNGAQSLRAMSAGASYGWGTNVGVGATIASLNGLSITPGFGSGTAFPDPFPTATATGFGGTLYVATASFST